MEVSIHLLLSLFFTLSLGLFVTATTDGDPVDGAFWDTFFSDKLTHQLSGANDKVYSELGAMVTSNYSGTFKVPMDRNTTYKAEVTLRTYRKLVVFYRGARGETGDCSALIWFGTNPTPLCIQHGADNSTAPEAPMYTFSQTLNYATVNIRLTFTNHAVGGQNLQGYRFYYLMYDRMKPFNFPPYDSAVDYPVPVPALLASDSNFPQKAARGVDYNLTEISINVLLYDNITVSLLIANANKADCNQAYFEIGSHTKLCGNQTSATIDVTGRDHINAIYSYTVPPPSNNIGMLIQVAGTVRTPHRYKLCSMTTLSSSANQGVIYSPNYPTNNTPAVGSCLLGFSEYYQMISYTVDWTTSSGSGDCTKAILKLNGLQNGSATVVCGGASKTSEKDKILYQPFSIDYHQLTSTQQPGLAFQFEAFHFEPICEPKDSPAITSLPYRLMTPNFPRAYPGGILCHVVFNLTVSKIAVNFKAFQLEESSNCEHDYLHIFNAHRLCGERLQGQKQIFEVSNTFFIAFKSDLSIFKSGFAIEITNAELPLNTSTTTLTTTPTTTPTTTSTTTTSTTISTTIAPPPRRISKVTSGFPSPTQVSTKTAEVSTSPIATDVSKMSPKSGNLPKTTTAAQNAVSSTIAGKQKVAKVKEDGGTPGYVWGILVTVLVVGVAAAVVIVLVLKRRRSHFRLSENDNLDVGFENPIYGQRQDGEMVRLERSLSN